LASDISNIIKSEISSTLESLLSAKSKVEEVVQVSFDEIEETECINSSVAFNFAGKNTKLNFFIPTSTATQFEYLMLGGVTDLKDSIDEEITDAVKEIISTISGSLSTSINAQGFPDLSDIKGTLEDTKVIQLNEHRSNDQLFKFIVQLNDDYIEIFLSFDQNSLAFIKQLTGEEDEPEKEDVAEQSTSIISSLLGEESVDNLKLLFDIKMRLSVRLGTKVCLLRDVISWDIGEIIELSQMTNEPLDILINGVVIGSGEAIIADGKFGVKIKHIGKIK